MTQEIVEFAIVCKLFLVLDPIRLKVSLLCGCFVSCDVPSTMAHTAADVQCLVDSCMCYCVAKSKFCEDHRHAADILSREAKRNGPDAKLEWKAVRFGGDIRRLSDMLEEVLDEVKRLRLAVAVPDLD